MYVQWLLINFLYTVQGKYTHISTYLYLVTPAFHIVKGGKVKVHGEIFKLVYMVILIKQYVPT